MGIHQTLIGGYAGADSSDWVVTNHNSGSGDFTVPASSLQTNDLIVFAAGSDSSNPIINIFSSFSVTTLENGNTNSIQHDIKYGVVPATPSDIEGRFSFTDYALIMGFRRSGSTSSYNVSTEATTTTTTSPSHNNTSVAFSQDDLALLLAFVDDDATPMTPPTDSTKIAEDQDNNRGSIGAAYKQIDTAGNYSWGSWTTSGTDNTLAFVIKIQEA
ncbi:MAG: hypothetical protein GY880_23795 [Planctomycetaceae bacterium]|nr:hypothetical protein [Planctomycetaceae bacterium]